VSLHVTFHRSARDEFFGAIAWYESKRSGLALEFIAEIERCISLAAKSPFQFASVGKGVRRVIANRFPYSVYFRPEENRIIILAVFHSRRDPAIWPGRTSA
jgi:plasmid stabilization system protein ParE